MRHTHPHAGLLLQQRLDGFPRCSRVLLVIRLQPGADRAMHFGGMPLTSVVPGRFSARQHALPQPIRGCPAYLEPCRLHCFAPGVPLKHGASHLDVCDSMISCLHGGLLPARRGMRHAALGLNHPRWNKAHGSRRCRVPPAAQRPHGGERSAGVLADLASLLSASGLWRLLALAKAWAIRRRSDARCAESHRKPRDTVPGTCGGVMPPRLSANEGGAWCPHERSLPA
jgi:hypothetical protein